MYKNHTTWAQHEEQKKNIRDKYFENKMNDAFKKTDYQRELISTKRTEKWSQAAMANRELIKKRSEEKLFQLKEEKEKDKAMV